MRDTLKAYLRIIPSASAEMMAQELGLPHREVQEMLHQMDDDGDVILRSGWYRLSEAAKMRLGDSPEERKNIGAGSAGRRSTRPKKAAAER